MGQGELQFEFQHLLQEGDPALRAEGLLGFARRIEEQRPDAAHEIYSQLAHENELPKFRDMAKLRLDNLLGRGKFGPRFESLLQRFAREACDPKTILPMIFASSLAGATKAFAYGRLAALDSAAWYSRGFGPRALATAAGFAAEVPAFALSARAMHAIGGTDSQAPIGRDLASAALTLGSLKLFGSLRQQLFPGGHPYLSQGFSFAGLYSAHYLEEELGWRSKLDGAARATESLASLFSLGVGGRLGERFLGPHFRAFQIACELGMQENLQLKIGIPALALRRTGILGPLWMAASGDGAGDAGKIRGQLPALAQDREAAEKGYILNRSLGEYRQILSLTLMGDLIRNIEARLASSPNPVRVLELGSGKGRAARELKARFRDRLRVETFDRYPSTEGGVDRHHEGDWLETPMQGEFDIILSIFGPHAHHEGRLLPMLQKTFSHLAPQGEFAAILTNRSLQDKSSQKLRQLGEFSYMKASLDRGLALWFEEQSDSSLFYAKRIASETLPSLEELLAASFPAISKMESPQGVYPGRRFRGLVLTVDGKPQILEDRALAKLESHLQSFGISLELPEAQRLVQDVFEDFSKEVSQRYGRPPRVPEIQDWLSGREPSPLWQKPLLLDALIRLGIRDATAKKSSKVGGVVAVGVGLAALFDPRIAFAASESKDSFFSSLLDHSLLLVGGASLAIGLGLEIAKLYREKKLPANPPIEEEVAPVVISTEAVAAKSEPVKSEPPWWDVHQYLKPLPRGWVKTRRQTLEALLRDARAPLARKEKAVDIWFQQYTNLKFTDAERVEANALLWDLCWNENLGEKYRETLFQGYRILLNESAHFPENSPRTYREAMRLRSIYSDAKFNLAKRVRAAEAYGSLVSALDLTTQVGFGEAHMGRQELGALLRANGIRRGTRKYHDVNLALQEIEAKFRDLERRAKGQMEH